MAKNRQSNFELLRIFSMLLIISFHYVYKSGYILTELNFSNILIKFFYFFGELGVNLFVLITGYFQVKGNFSFKKLIKIILEVNFYYILTTIIIDLLLGLPFSFLESKKSLFMMFFAVIFFRYWFVTAYVLLYILSPFINKFITKLSKNDLKKFILTILILWCVIPTFFGFFSNTSESLLFYNRFIWLLIIYIIGAYIRLYSLKIFKSKRNIYFTVIFSVLTMLLSLAIIWKFKMFFTRIGTTDIAYFWHPNTIPMLLLSASIFELFANLKIKSNNFINLISSTTLGIYVLHDGVLSSYLWNVVFKTNINLHTKYFLVHIILATLIIFIGGSIIDLLRQLLEKITINKLLNSKLYGKLENKVKNIFLKICNYI